MRQALVKALFLIFVFGFTKIIAIENAVYVTYVNEIVNAFSKEMKRDFNLICIGDGGAMPHDVEKVIIMFSAYRKTTIEEARELEVGAVQRFLQLINAHEKIRPYLREYPFTPKRVEISISFQKKNNSHYADGSVAFIYQTNNKIVYRSVDPKTQELVALADETYEEALKLVQGIKNQKAG